MASSAAPRRACASASGNGDALVLADRAAEDGTGPGAGHRAVHAEDRQVDAPIPPQARPWPGLYGNDGALLSLGQPRCSIVVVTAAGGGADPGSGAGRARLMGHAGMQWRAQAGAQSRAGLSGAGAQSRAGLSGAGAQSRAGLPGAGAGTWVVRDNDLIFGTGARRDSDLDRALPGR